MICNECDRTNPKDDKWTNMIDGMQIYNAKYITDFLKQNGFQFNGIILKILGHTKYTN